MGTLNDTLGKASLDAAYGNGENDKVGAGPESFLQQPEFEHEGKPGNYWGDKTIRKMPDKGADLSLGLSCRESFHDEDSEELGMGRDDSTGKPDGPEMGKVDNEGASAGLEWG